MMKKKIGKGEFETIDDKWYARTIWQEWDKKYDEPMGKEFILIEGKKCYREGSNPFCGKYYLKHFIREK